MATTKISEGPPFAAIQKLYDYGAGTSILYEGWAQPGVVTSAPLWAIRKYVYSGSNLSQEQWADGNTNMDNVWDNRTGLIYA